MIQSTLTSSGEPGESSAVVLERVLAARERSASAVAGDAVAVRGRGAGGRGAAVVAAGSAGVGVVGSRGADGSVDRSWV